MRNIFAYYDDDQIARYGVSDVTPSGSHTILFLASIPYLFYKELAD